MKSPLPADATTFYFASFLGVLGAFAAGFGLYETGAPGDRGFEYFSQLAKAMLPGLQLLVAGVVISILRQIVVLLRQIIRINGHEPDPEAG